MEKNFIIIAIISQVAVEIITSWSTGIIGEKQISRLIASLIIISILYQFIVSIGYFKFSMQRSKFAVGCVIGLGLFGVSCLNNVIYAYIYSCGIISDNYAPAAITYDAAYSLLGDGYKAMQWASAIIIPLLVAPVLEEILFRGLMYQGLKIRLGKLPALLIVSSVFAMFHSDGYYFYFFIYSIFLCLAFDKYKSLLLVIVAHSAANVLVLVNLYSIRAGYFNNFDKVFFPTEWIFELIYGLASIAAIVLLLINKQYIAFNMKQDIFAIDNKSK